MMDINYEIANRTPEKEQIERLEEKVLKLSIALLIACAFSVGAIIYIVFLLIYSVTLQSNVQVPILLVKTPVKLLAQPNSSDIRKRCEDGWKYLADNDIGFCYAAWFMRNVSQSAAKRYCQNYQSNLVSIRSFVEDQFVLELATEIRSITRIWTGLEWNPIMGLRRWNDGSIEVIYDNGVVGPKNLTKTSSFSKDSSHPYGAKCIRCETPQSEGVWYFLKEEQVDDPILQPDGFVCKKRRSYLKNEALEQTHQSKCDPKWAYFQETNQCYFLQNFTHSNVIDSRQFTMIESENNCQVMGGHLVSIHSKDEREFVKSLIVTNLKSFLLLADSDFGCSFIHGAWIGLHQANGTRTWTDGSNDDFFSFRDNEPNVTYTMCNDVANTYADSVYHDIETNSKFSRYVCKKGANK